MLENRDENYYLKVIVVAALLAVAGSALGLWDDIRLTPEMLQEEAENGQR